MVIFQVFHDFQSVWELSSVMSSFYLKYSKISNTFHFLFSKKMWIIKAGIHKILVRIVNREDSDQTASSEAV